MKQNIFKKIKNFFYSRQYSFNAKLLVSICILTFFSGLISFFVSFSFKSMVTTLVALVTCILSVIILIFYLNTKKHNFSLFLFFIVYNFFLLPLNFFVSGGNASGMPYYFLLAIVISVILLPEKHRILLSFLLLLYDSGLILLNTFLPDIVLPLPNRTAIIYDSFVGFFMSSLSLCFVLHLLTRENRVERSKVENFNKYLQDQSIHDPLTNLYNRRYLLNVLDREVLNAKENGTPLSVVMFDIDFFKKVNDTYGHLTGDEVLRNFSQLLLMETIDTAVAGRYGGEEFLIILSGKTAKEAFDFADNMRSICASNSLMASNNEIVTISGGVGEYKSDMNVIELIDEADSNLYKAKNSGRNKVIM